MEFDPGYNTEILLWMIVECCIGLVCACLPCMTPLTRIFSKKSKSTSGGYSGGKGPAPIASLSARRWPGGRRLSTCDDDDEQILTEVAHSSSHSDKEADMSGDKPLQRSKEGQDAMFKSTVTNKAYSNDSTDVESGIPMNSIKVQKGIEWKSERIDNERDASAVAGVFPHLTTIF